MNYLLIFYLIFECVCNGFAEITRFADREFYQDWWNATSFDEFSRRWNVPVHSFLLRHVYTSTIDNYRFSKFRAAFVTFLLSAVSHRQSSRCTAMPKLTRRWFETVRSRACHGRFVQEGSIVFVCLPSTFEQFASFSSHASQSVYRAPLLTFVTSPQMAQLPLIMIGRLPVFRRNPTLGNVSCARSRRDPRGFSADESPFSYRCSSGLASCKASFLHDHGLGTELTDMMLFRRCGFPLLGVAYIRF